jgi:hypothetical protein
MAFLAGFEPFLVVISLYLGWKADQFGKVFIAAIAALGLSILGSWLIGSLGLPWIASVSHGAPTLYPVRAVAALFWASGAYGTRKLLRR